MRGFQDVNVSFGGGLDNPVSGLTPSGSSRMPAEETSNYGMVEDRSMKYMGAERSLEKLRDRPPCLADYSTEIAEFFRIL